MPCQELHTPMLACTHWERPALSCQGSKELPVRLVCTEDEQLTLPSAQPTALHTMNLPSYCSDPAAYELQMASETLHPGLNLEVSNATFFT